MTRFKSMAALQKTDRKAWLLRWKQWDDNTKEEWRAWCRVQKRDRKKIAKAIQGTLDGLRANSTYKRDLLNGHESWSGASLKGRAQEYGSKYKRSREKLLEQLNQNSLAVAFFTGLRSVDGRSRRVLLALVGDREHLA